MPFFVAAVITFAVVGACAVTYAVIRCCRAVGGATIARYRRWKDGRHRRREPPDSALEEEDIEELGMEEILEQMRSAAPLPPHHAPEWYWARGPPSDFEPSLPPMPRWQTEARALNLERRGRRQRTASGAPLPTIDE